MDDAEFCRKYSRLVVDARLPQLEILCEGFIRSCDVGVVKSMTAEELSVQLVSIVRGCDNALEAYQKIHDHLEGLMK